MAETKKTTKTTTAPKPKKEHTIVAAQGGEPVTHQIKDAKESGNATGLRIGAVVLWVVAIGLEILAVLMLNGTVNLTFMPTLVQLIVALVLDLVCVIIGAQLWKKSNRIDPASEKNKLKFWLWNNMGVIACVLAFLPFIILVLTNKEADGKTKKIAVIVAIVALLIGGLASYDFDPISAEEKAEQEAEYGDTIVYWSPFGKVYHTHEDCHALNQTDTLTQGTVTQAIEAGRQRVCSYCEKRDAQEGDTDRDQGSETDLQPAA